MKRDTLHQHRIVVNQALSMCHRRGVSHTLLCALLLLATGCVSSWHDIRTTPTDYRGPISERVRITKLDGEKGVLWDAYIDGGVLHGTGYNEGARREQKYAFALTELQRIETERDDTAISIVTSVLVWCGVNMITDRHCAWPLAGEN